jgi:hypothetical protein
MDILTGAVCSTASAGAFVFRDISLALQSVTCGEIGTLRRSV